MCVMQEMGLQSYQKLIPSLTFHRIEPNLLSMALGLAKARSWYSFIALPLNLFSLRPKLLVSCSILSKKLVSGDGTPFCFCLNIHVIVDKYALQCNDYTSSENVYVLFLKYVCTFIFFDWELGMPIRTTITFIGLIWKFIIQLNTYYILPVQCIESFLFTPCLITS